HRERHIVADDAVAVHEVRIVEITRFRDVSDVLADADIGHEHPAVREAFREGHLDAVVLTVQFRIVVPHHIELAPGCRILVVHRHLPPAGGFRNLDRRVPRSGYGQVPAADDPANSSTVVPDGRSEEHTSELQSRRDLVCRLLLEKKKKKDNEKQIEKIKKKKITKSRINSL